VQPVLLIHVCPHPCLVDDLLLTKNTGFDKGDSNEVFPPEAAFHVQEQLVNAKDGARLFFIRGTYIVLACMCAAHADIRVSKEHKVASAWYRRVHPSPTASSRRSSRVYRPRARMSRYRQTMRCSGSRISCTIPKSECASRPRPWRSLVSHLWSCVGGRTSTRARLWGTGVRSPR
jgi:hypothetical protein